MPRKNRPRYATPANAMPYEQISEVMGTSVGALKASYHFAYEKVKDYLLRHGVE